MRYKRFQKDNIIWIENEGGVTLSLCGVPVLEQDGYAFKDLAKTGELLPYEDWRLDAKTRAEDLAKRLSVEAIAGLMLYSSHQLVPFSEPGGPFTGHYNGRNFAESGQPAWALTDEQKGMLERGHIRHFLQMQVKDAETSARWSNELQAMAEQLPWGIPVNISTDPRHGASSSSAEFKNKASDVSKWPEGIGMAATFEPELVKEFAKIAAKEYRALGITTALGPQIDLATEPRWMRMEDTFGGDVSRAVQFTKAYCDGMQTTDNTVDGWGLDSVAVMVKHWPGGGTGEGGRDAHYAFGAYAVYPGDNFAEHLKPFTEGAFALDGPTGHAAAVMPYYTVSWGIDSKNGENVGNSYSEYIVKDLLRDTYSYDGIVCTDWGITEAPLPDIDGFGSRCFGVEKLSEAERHLRILMNGVDQFGGNNRIEPVLEAYQIGCQRYGESVMRRRMELSAVRLLHNMFRLGLFEHPFLDARHSAEVVGCQTYVEAGLEAQRKSVVALKNKNHVLPLKKGIKIFIPNRTIGKQKSFMRWWNPETTFSPVSRQEAEGYFTLVDTLEEAEAALVWMESPLTDGGYDEGYQPISLQYRPYCADSAREESIAGGDFRELSANRSYRGKTVKTANERDLDNVLEMREQMGDKPVIVCVEMHNPTVPAEFEGSADAIVIQFGVEKRAVFDILFGNSPARGRLPYALPENMETVEQHCEDVFGDFVAYRDVEGNEYGVGFGLGIE